MLYQFRGGGQGKGDREKGGGRKEKEVGERVGRSF
jgi:hypothetical protein